MGARSSGLNGKFAHIFRRSHGPRRRRPHIGAVRLDRPVLPYDGRMRLLPRMDRGALAERGGRSAGLRTFQRPPPTRFPAIARERFAAAVQLMSKPGGRVSEGAEAVFRALALAPGRGGPLALYRHVPASSPRSPEAIYRGVAASPRRDASAHPRGVGAHVVPTGHTATAWSFLKGCSASPT